MAQTERHVRLFRKGRVLAVLASLEPLEEKFNDVDEDLESLDDVELRACRSAICWTPVSSRTSSDVHEASRSAEVGEDSVCTSIVVAAELRYGSEKSE